MRKLSIERRAAILSALVEGNSIASTCRMFAVNKVTVLRLLADAGSLAADYHDLTVRDLNTKRIQMDEIWSYVFCKRANVTMENYARGRGDCWTWVALDADSKLVINWLVGDRSGGVATEFARDTASRLNDAAQITSDGYAAYRTAIPQAFGRDVDWATIIKEFASTKSEGRYSPGECICATINVESGSPDPKHINTSYVERQNLSVRMGMRRFTRLTNGFSKRLENHQYAIALYYFHYNFIRKHQTIKTTPAVMAGVADREWTMVDFVKLLEKEEELRGGRLTDYKMAASKRAAN